MTRLMSATEENGRAAGWRRGRLEDLSAFITKGSTPTTFGFTWAASGVLFLRSECVSEHGLDLRQSMFISEEAHAALKRSEILPDDLLVTITGNVGRVARFVGTDRANLNQHIARLRITAADAESQFVYYWLSQPSVRRYFEGITTGQAYPQLSLKQVRDTEIPLPALPEQRAIAKVLGDVDALLDGLTRLIAKKRDVKQAAMQQLLTGLTRLRGFRANWKPTRLGDLLRFQVGFPFSSAHFNEKEEGLRLVRNRDLKSDDQCVFYRGKYESAYIVRDGDLLVGMDGDFLPCKWMKGTALLNQRVGRIMPKPGLNSVFAYYAMAEPLRAIESVTSSTTVKHLSHSDVENIERPWPCLAEQDAIATVLSDIDADLAALEARRAKMQAIKQAMMQSLLTGRIRLVTSQLADA